MISVPPPPSSHLPVEIIELIIDHITSARVLGNCSLVCTDWLPRSRHHLFKTVHLWSWRVCGFLDLVNTRGCTFSEQIERIEVDDARRRRLRKTRSRSPSPSTKARITEPENLPLSFMDMISLLCSVAPNVSIHTLSIHNVDWTSLSLQQRTRLRHDLASSFHGIHSLELCDATFHDTREVTRILEVFPQLKHLTADVKFTKYAAHLRLSSGLGAALKSLDVGTDDAIQVFLASAKVEALTLRNIKLDDFKYIHPFMKKEGAKLKDVHFELDAKNFPTDKPPPSDEDVLGGLNFSKSGQLRTLSIQGLTLTSSSKIPLIIERNLLQILSSIESSCLDVIALGFHLENGSPYASIELDWKRIQHVLLGLHFFGLRRVYFSVDVEKDQEVAVAKWVQGNMPDLFARGVLQVEVQDSSRGQSSFEDVEMNEILSEGLQGIVRRSWYDKLALIRSFGQFVRSRHNECMRVNPKI